MTSTTKNISDDIAASERRQSLLAATILGFGVVAMVAWCCALFYVFWYLATS